MATEVEMLTWRIISRAILPVIKVYIQDDAAQRAKFGGVSAVVQFTAKDAAGPVGAYLKFSPDGFETQPGIAEDADLTFTFGSVAAMNGFFAGKLALPRIRGITRVGLLIKVVGVLLGLKILMPDARPKTPEQARLKVKLTLFMVSTALSQLNKAGDADMAKWTSRQPERIYQWSVAGEDDMACYLKIKAGKTKAGRGMYERRKPFVHMRFASVAAALPVLTNNIDIVQAIAQGLVANEGSPEYGAQIGDFMLRIAALVS